MSFKLSVSHTVLVPVEGHLPDDTGRKVPFSFRLVCKRLGAEQLKAQMEQSDATVPEFLAGVVSGWEGVQGDDGQAVPFSAAALQELMNIVGMAGVCFQAYFGACGAKAKEKN